VSILMRHNEGEPHTMAKNLSRRLFIAGAAAAPLHSMHVRPMLPHRPLR
jgi:hypothetical protein